MGLDPPTIFPGTTEERDALLAAVQAACSCTQQQDGRTQVCGAHALLLDQRGLKHLIFFRRLHRALWPSERAGLGD